MYVCCGPRRESAHNPTRRAVQIVIQCDQTSSLATSIMLCSEEVRRPFQRLVNFLAQERYNMSTLLIVLLVLFLLGGGGWGYSRWRG
jgi:hypothetical protein